MSGNVGETGLELPNVNLPLGPSEDVFPDIAYLDWIVGRPEQAEYDLGSSDLRRAPADSGRVVPPVLADMPTPEVTVEEQLADRYGVASENVLLTAGATHANFLAAAAALREVAGATDEDAHLDGSAGSDSNEEPPARVLVEKPGYEPLLATPRGIGATVDRYRRPEGKGYPLDPDRVTGALVENTALVTVTNRHNPSGRRVGRDALAATADAVADADARLLVDEVYAPFESGSRFESQPRDVERSVKDNGKGAKDIEKSVTTDEAATGPFGGPTAAGLPNAVVTNSLTKFLGFPGVRLGWLVADEAFVAHARTVKHHVPAVAEPSERLAGRALARAPELTAESRERIRANHDALAGFLADREDLSGRIESGCTYAFLEHEYADGTEVARAAWEQGILVVPGRFFDDLDRFRISACREPETVQAGLDRLGDVLDSLGRR
jgi:aspartate/methionine/tyrosine aminotransferase